MSAWTELRDRFGGPLSFLQHGYLDVSQPVPTLIEPLDRNLSGGMLPGLHVLGGEPGSGKSALGLFIAFMAALSGANVMFASLEMGAAMCWARVASCASLTTGPPFGWSDVWVIGEEARRRQVDARRAGAVGEFVNGWLLESDPVGRSVSRLLDTCPGLVVADASKLPDLESIEGAAREAAGLGLSLLVVDYLQYVSMRDEAGRDEYSRVSAVSRRLSALGVSLDVPVLALASFNRGAAAGRSRKPAEPSERTEDMHGFRGSGSIEYDAVSAWVLTSDAEEEGMRRLHVVKNRAGALTGPGGIPLRFDGAHNSFSLM